MKQHFLLLFDSTYRWTTLSLFLAAVLLIIASQIVGTTDNLPGLIMLFFGMISFFLTFLHPWRKSGNYAILAGIFLGIIVLMFGIIYLLDILNKTEYISEGVVMILFFLICIPGIVVGIFGTIFFAVRNK